MSSLIDLRERARAIARGEIGQKEEGGNNKGPRVEEYLECAGLPPGQNWCVALLYWAYDQAAEELGLINPLPRTGRGARLWARCKRHYRSSVPTLGAIYIHFADPSDPDSDSHVGIIDELLLGRFKGIEGNTNAKGSRVGDQVRLQLRAHSYAHGYIDVGREGPAEPPGLVS